MTVKYKLVLVAFPFDDLSSQKVRPAVCLTEPIGPHRHVVLAFVTSKVRWPLLPTDVPITPEHPDFAATGLKVSSVLQVHRLVTVSTRVIRRELGILPESLQVEVRERLRRLFDLSTL